MYATAPRMPLLPPPPPHPAVWSSFIAMIISAHAIRRYTGSKQAGTRWFFFLLCTGQSMTFYTFLLPM